MMFATPVESSAEFPTFCGRCGRRLVVEDRVAGFDGQTGTPRYVAYAWCRRSWLARIFGSFEWHEQYVVSPRPAILPKRPNPTALSR